MAQHFQMRYIDDIDGTDLGDNANADTFRQLMAPYIEAGHRVTGKSKTARKRRTATLGKGL